MTRDEYLARLESAFARLSIALEQQVERVAELEQIVTDLQADKKP